jgi:hypothetical protein
MTTNETTYQWWYARAEGISKTIACWATSAADAAHYMIVFEPDFIVEDITYEPSPTPPEGIHLHDCYLLGKPDVLAEIALECERTAEQYKLIQRAMFNSWPTEKPYAVIGGSLWQRTKMDTIILLQENI